MVSCYLDVSSCECYGPTWNEEADGSYHVPWIHHNDRFVRKRFWLRRCQVLWLRNHNRWDKESSTADFKQVILCLCHTFTRRQNFHLKSTILHYIIKNINGLIDFNAVHHMVLTISFPVDNIKYCVSLYNLSAEFHCNYNEV